MDYPLDWRQIFMTVFSLENSEKILKFSKIVIVEFSDSPTKFGVFFVQKNSVGQAT